MRSVGLSQLEIMKCTYTVCNGLMRSSHWSLNSDRTLRFSSRKLADTCKRRNISTSLLDMAANSAGFSVGCNDTCTFSKAGFTEILRDGPAPMLNALLTVLCLRSIRFGCTSLSIVVQLFHSYGHSSSVVCVDTSGCLAFPIPRQPNMPQLFFGGS